MRPRRVKDPLFCPGCGNHLDACCCGQGHDPFDEPIDPDQDDPNLALTEGLINGAGLGLMLWAVIFVAVGGLCR